MARSLYRIYLYVVCAVLLGFIAFSLGNLLNTLLLLTPLRQADTAPDSTAVVQALVLAAVALVVSLGLGGLHYQLIRRDIAQDAGAARGAVRALALNFLQAVAALVALNAGGAFLSRFGRADNGSLTSSLATTLIGLAAFALLQLERNQAQPAHGAPSTLQRLHLYGVHTVILFTGLTTLARAVGDTVTSILAGAGSIFSACEPIAPPKESFGPPFPFGGCDLPSGLVGDYLALAWVVGAWLLYGWLTRGDTRSVLRQVAHFFGLVVGLVSVVVGIERAVELGLRAALHATDNVAVDLAQSWDFFPWLLGGALVLAVYVLWLAREADQMPLGRTNTDLTILALAGIVLGVPLYVGIGQFVHDLIERVAPQGTPADSASLAVSGGLLVAGLAHPYLAYLLHRRTLPEVAIGPRRGLVLAGLAAGALSAAIGGAVALYLAITALLGSPLGPDWPAQARTALTFLIVGGFVAGIHLWRVLTERKLIVRPSPAPASTSPAASIEGVLDALLAGRITRDEAAAQLRALAGHSG